MYNHAVLIGRLTANPELKNTTTGTAVCSFTVACDRQFKGQDGERHADFINVVAWRNTAEFVAKYFAKGNPIGVAGSIQTRSYTDKDGNKRTVTEVVADRAFFVGGKENNAGKQEERHTGGNSPLVDDYDEGGDLLF